MRRKFLPFDTNTIYKEMEALADSDFIALQYAMARYVQSAGSDLLPPAMVEGNQKYNPRFRPIYIIRHRSGTHQGRALFYFGQMLNGIEPLYVLVVYKKEKDETPRELLEAAYQRMLKHQEKLDGLA